MQYHTKNIFFNISFKKQSYQKIGNACDEIDKKVSNTTVSCMFNLTGVFQKVIDRLYNSTLSQ